MLASNPPSQLLHAPVFASSSVLSHPCARPSDPPALPLRPALLHLTPCRAQLHPASVCRAGTVEERQASKEVCGGVTSAGQRMRQRECMSPRVHLAKGRASTRQCTDTCLRGRKHGGEDEP
eukprot:1429124-Rhodomonas_salina.1